MNPDSSNVELDSVKQAEEGEYVQEGVQQEEGNFSVFFEKFPRDFFFWLN